MAYTVGKFGLHSLVSLARLMVCVYITCGLFIGVGLGAVLRLLGLRLWPLLRYLKEEILLVLGTSTSESALPRMLLRMEQLGCGKSVVGLVLPAGYSLNLDGTCIYLTMAAVFIAQATDTPLPLERQLAMLSVLLLTSKGAAAVTGGGFVTLAATLTATGNLPVAGLTLLLGVDRFMSADRALTNLIGNAVATVVVSKWEGELDEKKLRRELGMTDGG
jgi:aerobic C4-dicarboxylate transport protein